MANTLFSFAEDFAAIVVFSGDKFEADLDELARFFRIVGYSRYELVVWQVFEEVLFKLNV